MDVATDTVVTDTGVYEQGSGSLDASKATAKCPEERTFVNYDREKCTAYATHNNLKIKYNEATNHPRGCTKRGERVYFNTQHGRVLCNQKNSKSSFQSICRTMYDKVESVGFCKMTAAAKAAAAKAAAEKEAAAKAAAEKAAAEKAAAEKAANAEAEAKEQERWNNLSEEEKAYESWAAEMPDEFLIMYG